MKLKNYLNKSGFKKVNEKAIVIYIATCQFCGCCFAVSQDGLQFYLRLSCAAGWKSSRWVD
jgi:hypothetical protein